MKEIVVKFQDGAIYHIFDDRFVDGPSVGSRTIARLSTIEWCNTKQAFEIRWHPYLLNVPELNALLCNERYETRQAALDAENNSVNGLMQLRESILVFDRILVDEVGLQHFRCRE